MRFGIMIYATVFVNRKDASQDPAHQVYNVGVWVVNDL